MAPPEPQFSREMQDAIRSIVRDEIQKFNAPMAAALKKEITEPAEVQKAPAKKAVKKKKRGLFG